MKTQINGYKVPYGLAMSLAIIFSCTKSPLDRPAKASSIIEYSRSITPILKMLDDHDKEELLEALELISGFDYQTVCPMRAALFRSIGNGRQVCRR